MNLSSLKKITKHDLKDFGSSESVYIRSLTMSEVRAVRDEHEDPWEQTKRLLKLAVCNEAGESVIDDSDEIDNYSIALVDFLSDLAIGFGAKKN